VNLNLKFIRVSKLSIRIVRLHRNCTIGSVEVIYEIIRISGTVNIVSVAIRALNCCCC